MKITVVLILFFIFHVIGEGPKAVLPSLTVEELLEHRKEKLIKKKQRIAYLANAVQENPEKNVRWCDHNSNVFCSNIVLNNIYFCILFCIMF